MKTFAGSAAALAAAAFLWPLAGCSLFGSAPAPEAPGDAGEHGELCAAPASFGAFCVP